MVAIYDKELDCFLFPSKSTADKHYMLFYSTTDQKWWCDCLGFYYSKYTYCKHCDMIKYTLRYKKESMIINFDPSNALLDYDYIVGNKKMEVLSSIRRPYSKSTPEHA